MAGTWRRWRRARERDRQRREGLARERTSAEKLARRATGWMVWLSLLLFFAPPLNGLLGGGFGGYLLGSARAALRHEVFPALGWALAAVTLVGFVFTPFLGYVTLIPAAWLLITGVGLILGGLAGGALADSVHRRREATV